MANNGNDTNWDPIVVFIIVIIVLFGISKTIKTNMVNNLMEDTEFREEMNIDNRDEAEQFIDDHS